jgi:membrane-associated phospholipid phosphatase
MSHGSGYLCKSMKFVKSRISKTAFTLLGLSGFLFAQEPSPMELSWPFETTLLGMGAAGSAIGEYNLTHITPAGPADVQRSDLPPWDRFAAGWYNPASGTASDILAVTVGGSILFSEAWEKAHSEITWEPLLEDAVILGEAQAWSAALNLNVRSLRLHPRPFVYDANNGSSASDREAPEAAGSFYSGHASAAFLGAVYFSTVYPLRHPEFKHPGWLWAGSLAAGCAVAVLRVTAGEHFPSDVVAGAAVGSLLGWTFAKIHEHHPAKDSWSFNMWPQPGGFALQAVRPLVAL